MNIAILADRTDKKRTRGRQVTETRATTPVFPPGRYGRRRDGKRHLAAPIVLAVLVLVACLLLSVRLYRQYGDPDYKAQIVGWTDVTDTRMTIEFSVRVPAGGSAECVLRARTYEGAVVGRRSVTVRASGDDTTVDAREVVPTSARAAVGDVLTCRPPG
jgi:hypothetical protein